MNEVSTPKFTNGKPNNTIKFIFFFKLNNKKIFEIKQKKKEN